MGKLVIYIIVGLLGSYNLLFTGLIDGKLIKPEDHSDLNTISISTHVTNTSSLMNSIFLDDSLKTCVDCHEDHVTGEVVHGPAKKDCMRCHVSNGSEHPLEGIKGYNITKPIPDLCHECHDKMEKEFIHEPTGKGECATCHDLHSSDNLYLVKYDPVDKLCYECHELDIPEGNFIHGALTEGNCTGCHNVHEADNEAFLSNSKLDRLCKKCHKDFRKQLKNEFVHEPFGKKQCFECHEAHSAKEAHLSDLKTKDLCYSCHEDVHKEIESSNMVHGALNEAESCLTCHSSHASNHEKMMKLDNVAMCLSCHDEEIETDTTRIEAIGPHLSEGYTVHGAITEEGCSTCHSSHVSEEHSLLKQAYPEERYVKSVEDNFDLCFRCHSQDLIQIQRSSTATNFRDGEENLHYLHISKGKGRNCTICHDMHGTVNKFLIKQETAFGKWDMPINYEASFKGGTCRTGCHDERKYHREYAVYNY